MVELQVNFIAINIGIGAMVYYYVGCGQATLVCCTSDVILYQNKGLALAEDITPPSLTSMPHPELGILDSSQVQVLYSQLHYVVSAAVNLMCLISTSNSKTHVSWRKDKMSCN